MLYRRWRHSDRKFAVEIFQNVKKSAAELCQIFRMVIIDIVIINSTHVMGIRLYAAGIALPSR